MKSSHLKRLGFIAIGAVIMAVLPPGQTPHLIQKLTLLRYGYLTKPIDIFDLVVHGGLIVIMIGYAIHIGLKYLRRKYVD